MNRPRRELLIYMAIDCLISKNNQITLFTRFALILKIAMGLPKTGTIFYCVGTSMETLWRDLVKNSAEH